MAVALGSGTSISLFNAGNTRTRVGWGKRDVCFRQSETELPVGHLVN